MVFEKPSPHDNYLLLLLLLIHPRVDFYLHNTPNIQYETYTIFFLFLYNLKKKKTPQSHT